MADDITLQARIANNQPQDPVLDYWNLNGYLFDAWLSMTHDTNLTITQHPVQTGAAITDHSYVNPKRFNFQIGMTDVTTPLDIPGMNKFPTTPTKSLGAYDKLVELQSNREPLYLVSKYGYFEDILIESIHTPDDFRTKHGLKATITLVQIIMVDVKTARLSGLPHTTDQTNRGPISGRPIEPGTREAIRRDLINLGYTEEQAESTLDALGIN